MSDLVRIRVIAVGCVLTAAVFAAGGVGAAGKKGDTLDSLRPTRPPVAPPPKPVLRKPAAVKRAPVPQVKRSVAPPVPRAASAMRKAAVATQKPTMPKPATSTPKPVTTTVPQPVTPPPPPPDPLSIGRVAWWPMAGDARDLLGGSHGQLRRGVTAAAGMVGVGLQFDGKGSGISVPDSAALQLADSFTLSVWVNAATLPQPKGQAQIFFRGDSRSGMDPFSLYFSSNRNLGFVIQSATETNRMELRIPERTWVHVSAMLDTGAQKMRLYVNGKLAQERPSTLRPLRDLDPRFHAGIGIGNTQYDGEYDQPFYGLLDELQVHNRALSADEVAILARR